MGIMLEILDWTQMAQTMAKSCLWLKLVGRSCPGVMWFPPVYNIYFQGSPLCAVEGVVIITIPCMVPYLVGKSEYP